jgi:hypothetical protein
MPKRVKLHRVDAVDTQPLERAMDVLTSVRCAFRPGLGREAEVVRSYCVLVPEGGVDMDVSGDVRMRSASEPLVAASGVEGVLTVELLLLDSLAGFLSFFKTSSTLRPPALMSSPTPCMVLHPAMNATATAIATHFSFIMIS